MGIYEMLAKPIKGMTNLRKIFVVYIGILLLALMNKPWNFQSGILNMMNKPLPMLSSYTWGMVAFVVALIGLVGFFRKRL